MARMTPFDPDAYLAAGVGPGAAPSGVQVIEVEGPDGRVTEVEFPAGMSDAAITAAIKKNWTAIQQGPRAAGTGPGATIADLGKKAKAKYPGTYDSLSDEEVGRRVKAKHPDAYGDFADLARPQLMASHTPSLPPGQKVESRPPVGIPESGVRGALQGASFGFADEAAAAIDAALPGFLRNETSAKAVAPGLSDLVAGSAEDTYGARFRRARDYYRNRNAAAENANPGTYLAGELTGAVAAPGGAVRGLGRAVGQGAAMGLGYGEADLTRGEVGNAVSDMATGAAFGAAGHGVGKLARTGLSRLAGLGAQREALATARAGAQAAEEVAGGVQSAAGALGGETQKGSRYVENLMRLESSMTPQQRALYAQLQQQGIVPHLQQSVAQGTLDALPAQAGTIAAKQAELAALQAAAPQAVKARAAELLRPQVRSDAKSFAKSYAEPLLWALGAQQIGNAVGLDPAQQGILAGAAGIVGGRTRAGKALATRIKRPGHQAAIGRAEQRIAESRVLEALAEALRRGVPAVATDAATRDKEREAEAELARLLE